MSQVNECHYAQDRLQHEAQTVDVEIPFRKKFPSVYLFEAEGHGQHTDSHNAVHHVRY